MRTAPHDLHFNMPVELTVKLPDSVNAVSDALLDRERGASSNPGAHTGRVETAAARSSRN
jgi:hypothetical protein